MDKFEETNMCINMIVDGVDNQVCFDETDQKWKIYPVETQVKNARKHHSSYDAYVQKTKSHHHSHHHDHDDEDFDEVRLSKHRLESLNAENQKPSSAELSKIMAVKMQAKRNFKTYINSYKEYRANVVKVTPYEDKIL